MEEAQKEIIDDIKNWTKGKIVTKDKLREHLNKLKKKLLNS